MSDVPLIEVRDVTRQFEVGGQTITAVKDVSFEVGRGDFLAIIGRSGSGKTTLLNIVAGLDKPTSGSVLIEGNDVTTMSEAQLIELRRHKIGFVFQSFGLLPLLSAYENVEIAMRIAGAGVRERGRRSREVLDMMGLTSRMHHRPYELSGGEQQRVAIARAMVNRPSIILADEPTGELDSTTAQSIFQLLLDVVANEKVTIITTTHDRLVMEKAQRVLELADGELVTGETYFERDRRLAVAVAPSAEMGIGARLNNDPRLRRREEEPEPEQWSRPATKPAPYHPPPSPREPL